MVNASGVRLDHIHFRIGNFRLADICLEVRQGEYFVLSGPNGAGKTLLIELIAGLKNPDSGDVYLLDERVTDVPPWHRNIGYVPQDCALFPHRSVRENIEFGLEVRRVGKRRVKSKVDQIADLLGISHLLDRVPKGLSGGERQKASIARALVVNPSVLLLDEPVSSIDEDSRDALCRDFKRIQQETALTTIHVSHNRRETALLADRVGILTDGRRIELSAPL